MSEATSKLDRVTTSVIHNRLLTTAEAMGHVMLRTSRSPILSEARDFTTAIFDGKMRSVASVEYIPIQLGTASFTIRAIADFFKDEIHEGDVFALNDPYWGGNHLMDIGVVSPFFHDGSIEFWLFTKGHQTDLGGAMPGGYNPGAVEIWQEAFRIPPVKLCEKGADRRDVWNLILANCRIPEMLRGDLHAQIGALKVGANALADIIAKYGVQKIRASIDAIVTSSELMMRKDLEKIPDGEYVATRKIDDDGIDPLKPISIHVRVTKKGSELWFDYSGTDPQTRGFINSPFPNTCSATYISVFTVTDAAIPHNDGSMKPIHIYAPEGSLLNPRPPAAHQLDTLTSAEAIVETCWLALSKAIPHNVPAGWCRQASAVSSGINPLSKKQFYFIHGFLAKGGAGAVEGADGLNYMGSVASCGGQRAPSIELHESQTPFLVHTYELRQDSGGPGKWRGGLGIVCRWLLYGDEIILCKFGDGMRFPAFGLLRGRDGLPAVHRLIRCKKSVSLRSKGVYVLKKGDILEFRSGGGGGYGPAVERDGARMLDDVRNGIVSLESARRDYRAVISPKKFQLNQTRTKSVRS